jgi:hypothetical protein
MPDRNQFDPAFGRRYDTAAQLFIRYNHVPAVPTGLRVSIFDCAGQPLFIGDDPARLRARIVDPDVGDSLTATFAIWPVADPAHRTEVTAIAFSDSDAQVPVPDGVLVDGNTYDWTVRASDGTDNSAWSPACRFTWDRTRPSAPPTVTSTDYPENGTGGGPGVTGRFTLCANGVDADGDPGRARPPRDRHPHPRPTRPPPPPGAQPRQQRKRIAGHPLPVRRQPATVLIEPACGVVRP